jgi:hypothetical protein
MNINSGSRDGESSPLAPFISCERWRDRPGSNWSGMAAKSMRLARNIFESCIDGRSAPCTWFAIIEREIYDAHGRIRGHCSTVGR